MLQKLYGTGNARSSRPVSPTEMAIIMMQEARVKWRDCFNQKIAEPCLRRVTHRVAFGNSLRLKISTCGLRCKKEETSGLIVVSFDVRRRRVVASSETRQEVPFFCTPASAFADRRRKKGDFLGVAIDATPCDFRTPNDMVILLDILSTSWRKPQVDTVKSSRSANFCSCVPHFVHAGYLATRTSSLTTWRLRVVNVENARRNDLVVVHRKQNLTGD